MEAPQRPALQEVSQFMLLEREVEIQYRPRMLEALQDKVNAVAETLLSQTPTCAQCSQPMKRQDAGTDQWFAGAPAGAAGRSSAVYAGGTISRVAVGRQSQRHECLECSPAIGRVGRPL